MFFLTRTQQAQHHNTVKVPRVGLVFLPGIMGSRLELEVETDTGKKKVPWDPDRIINRGVWADMEPREMAETLSLKNPATLLDTADGVTTEQAARGWAGVVGSFYLPFLKRLESNLANVGNHRCIVYAHGYDWRKPTQDSAGVLGQRLRDLQQQDQIDQFILITHSMGGFVARHLLRSEGRDNAEFRRLVSGVIHLAQPVDGAVVAYRRFLTGAVVRDGWTEIDGSMRYLLGNTPEKVAEVLSVIPAALELLPNHRYQPRSSSAQWLVVSHQPYATPAVTHRWTDVYGMYVDTQWPPCAVPHTLSPEIQNRLRRGLRSAAKRVCTLVPRPDPKHPPGTPLEARDAHRFTFSVYSTGLRTDVQTLVTIDASGVHEVDFELSRTDEGDGTVPAQSASALFSSPPSKAVRNPDKDLEYQYEVQGVLHEDVCLDESVQEFVERIVHDVLTPPKFTSDGSITGEGSTVTRKRHEALTDKDTAAELRVAKLFRQRGHRVHLLADDVPTAGRLNPDMRIDDAFNVEVKRPVDIVGPNAASLIEHAVQQCGPGGQVYVVHSSDALQSLQDFITHANAHANAAGASGLGVIVVVVEERTLPELGSW